jgi:tetratricopeptide (TPR) repeat protein
MKTLRTSLYLILILSLISSFSAFASDNEAIVAYKQGMKLLKKGHPQDSIPFFNKAISLREDFWQAYTGRGLAYNNLGDHERAVSDCNKAIRIAPKKAWPYNNRGYAYYNLGQFDKAVRDFDKAISISPDYHWAFYNRSSCCFILGNGESDAAGAKEYLEISGWKDKPAQYIIIIGYFGYLQSGQSKMAANLLEKASSRCDSSIWPFPVIRYLKGEITAEKLLSKAEKLNKLTDVNAFIGINLSVTGHYDKALPYLRWVQNNGNREYTSTQLAIAEISRGSH